MDTFGALILVGVGAWIITKSIKSFLFFVAMGSTALMYTGAKILLENFGITGIWVKIIAFILFLICFALMGNITKKLKWG